MFPGWLKKTITYNRLNSQTQAVIRDLQLSTVCQSAQCPNLGECFSKGTATFLILGDVCTRRCGFCAIPSGEPEMPDPAEPEKILKAMKALKLNYVVITSVTRDDLEDGGAAHFAKTIRIIHRMKPDCQIEVLVPDFNGCKQAIYSVVDAHPSVFAHNIETVPRLYDRVRPGADYNRSISVLRLTKERDTTIKTKSGLLLGLGERDYEVINVLKDLKNAGVEIVTFGQYLSPAQESMKVEEFIHPSLFEEYKNIAKTMSFDYVSSGPFVRSSYGAADITKDIL